MKTFENLKEIQKNIHLNPFYLKGYEINRTQNVDISYANEMHQYEPPIHKNIRNYLNKHLIYVVIRS